MNRREFLQQLSCALAVAGVASNIPVAVHEPSQMMVMIHGPEGSGYLRWVMRVAAVRPNEDGMTKA